MTNIDIGSELRTPHNIWVITGTTEIDDEEQYVLEIDDDEDDEEGSNVSVYLTDEQMQCHIDGVDNTLIAPGVDPDDDVDSETGGDSA